jgi:hypothetical protein
MENCLFPLPPSPLWLPAVWAVCSPGCTQPPAETLCPPRLEHRLSSFSYHISWFSWSIPSCTFLRKGMLGVTFWPHPYVVCHLTGSFFWYSRLKATFLWNFGVVTSSSAIIQCCVDVWWHSNYCSFAGDLIFLFRPSDNLLLLLSVLKFCQVVFS